MPNYDPLHPAQSAIIEILCRKRGLKIAELHAALEEDFSIKISVQNLYRTVGQMVSGLMVFRDKGKLYLNLNWLNGVIRLIETAKENYVWNLDDAMDIPKEEGSVAKYRANSLFGLEAFWDHILLKLAHVTTMKEWYEYASHDYHSLAVPTAETAFYAAMKSYDINHHILIGNDSFLDTYADSLVEYNYPKILSNNTPFPSEGLLLFVCDDYIVESVIPESINQHFELFFGNVKTMDDFNAELFMNIFKMKADCKISVRKSADEAQKIRNKFKAFF